MSNKLTREVKYLQESDRPKKVEPLSFTEWVKTITLSRIHEMNYSELNHHATCYSTYLQEFSAEEVPVEWTGYLDKDKMVWNTGKIRQPTDLNDNSKLFYMGKDRNHWDMFYDIDSVGQICIFRGKLNSGKF